MGYCKAFLGRLIQNIEQMYSRKLTIRSDYSKIDELIISLQTDEFSPEGPEAQLLIESQNLNFYFNSLHQQISSNNLVAVKKYETLNDGLYVLLKGQISYMYLGNKNQMDRDFLRNTKNGPFRGMTGTATISQPFNVFECSLKNCASIEDSFLLKIQEESAINSRFYQYYNQRKDLSENHYLDFCHQQMLNTDQSSGIFTVDTKIHSNFSFKKYTFRQTVCLNSVGVISEGKAKLRDKRYSGSEMQRYGVLIPSISYEVTTAFLQVMYIVPNETLVLKVNLGCLKMDEEKKLPTLGAHSKKVSKENIMSKSLVTFDSTMGKRDREKRQKEVTKLSKQSEQYSILSAFLCQKSLTFAKKQSAKNKIREKREEKFKNPLVLFNIVNEKSKLATPNFANSNTSSTPSLQQRPITQPRSEIKSPTAFQGSPNLNILRKLRLPLKDYERMVKKHKTTHFRTDIKAKSLFTLTADKHLGSYQEDSQEQFSKYDS